MAKRYLMGIDGGTQSTKVIIVDELGKTVAQAGVALRPMHTTSDGVAEHPDDDLFDSLILAIKRALAQFTGNYTDIVAIGLGSIRYCRCLVKKDGSLAHPVLSWMDKRVSQAYQVQYEDVAYVTATTGYLMGRLTNSFSDTVANCLGQWPISMDNWKLLDDEAAYTSSGVRPEMMYEMKLPGDIGGHLCAKITALTGLPTGIPVVHTANDKAVEALGAGLQDQSVILLSLGTYIASMVVGSENVSTATNFWTNMACEPHRYLYESSGIRRGMWTVSWLKELLGKELEQNAKAANLSLEDYLNMAATNVPIGSDGLVCILDWLAPPNMPHRKGMFIGFDQRHGYAHMYRAILEGIALTMYNHSVAMIDELSFKPKELVVTGGGSHSDLFMQILADTYNMPAYRTENDSVAGLGSAICASVASGIYPNFASAVAKMVHRSTTFMPIAANVLKYQKINKAYATLSPDMDVVLKHLHEIQEDN